MKILFIPSEQILAINRLSPITLLRCQAALASWRKGEFDLILITGGIFNPPNIQTKPAAEIIADWLIARGIGRKQIICENTSRDTFENIVYGLKCLDLKTKPQITIISHWTHLFRFRLTLHRGLKWTLPLYWHPLFYGALRLHLQELIFISIHLLDPTGIGRIATWNRHRRTYHS